MAGALGFYFLPVAPLPQVEYPTINVNTQLPGASPETMASAVTTPLERSFGRIAGITEMTSGSNMGQAQVTMQFDLDRNIDAAANCPKTCRKIHVLTSKIHRISRLSLWH